MNVIFFEVDGVLNFEGSEAKAPDNTMGIAESRVKLLKSLSNKTKLDLFCLEVGRSIGISTMQSVPKTVYI